MRYGIILAAGAVLAATLLSAHADHARPGLLTDVGTPPAVERPGEGSTTTRVMVERCTDFVESIRTDKRGRIRDYDHDYETGFCLGWVNAAMVFMNFRDSSGTQMLGVCLPSGINSKQVAETFLRFAKRNPGDRVYNPSFLIYWSLLEQYPCERRP